MTLSLALSVDLAPPVDEAPGAELLSALALFALRGESAVGEWEINILVTDDAGIQEMHREFMGMDSPTDIMTFPFDDGREFVPVGFRAAGGDIVISIETAAENAGIAGWTVEREVQFLVIHGVLHLLGWDDETPEQRAAMLGRQQSILENWLAT